MVDQVKKPNLPRRLPNLLRNTPPLLNPLTPNPLRINHRNNIQIRRHIRAETEHITILQRNSSSSLARLSQGRDLGHVGGVQGPCADKSGSTGEIDGLN